MAKHTPIELPVKISELGNIHDGSGKVLCLRGLAFSRNHMRHIVKCVNNHAQLVDVVRRLLDAEIYADGEGIYALRTTDMAGSDDAVMDAESILAELDKGDE